MNPHEKSHTPLKRACLPVSALAQLNKRYYIIFPDGLSTVFPAFFAPGAGGISGGTRPAWKRRRPVECRTRKGRPIRFFEGPGRGGLSEDSGAAPRRMDKVTGFCKIIHWASVGPMWYDKERVQIYRKFSTGRQWIDAYSAFFQTDDAMAQHKC